MKIIRDFKLYRELKTTPEWKTLFTDDYELKNANIPTLAGGLDHIHVTRDAVQFHDIGCNGRDNSFKVCDQI